MAFVVVYDSSVLFSFYVRDLLVRCYEAELVYARWTKEIEDEWIRAVTRERHLPEETLRNTSRLMERVGPGSLVTGYQDLIESLTLPDPNDRHVLAAAIRCGAQTIVTNNLRDFPESALEPFNIEAQSPDEFVTDLLDLEPGKVLETLYIMIAAYKRPPLSIQDLLTKLRKSGLHESVAKINELLARLKG